MTREQFYAIRRMYRTACRLSHAAPGATGDNSVRAYIAAVTAMRAATGKWDTCEPVRPYDTWTTRARRCHWKGRPFVAAACTRWLATH